MSKPVRIGDATLYLGDCLEILRGLPDEFADALVTDPPYGIGFDYSGKREATNNPSDYWAWLGPIYREAVRCIKPGGLIAVWQAQLNFRYFWEWFGAGIHVYAACKNFVQLRKTPINYGYDPVVMHYKGGGSPRRPTKPRRNIDYFVANTAAVVSDRSRPEKAHPCPRPLDQTTEIIENFVSAGGAVLDPFMGSGTTGLGCLNTGRNFIGVEIDPTYFAIAERRIRAATPTLALA